MEKILMNGEEKKNIGNRLPQNNWPFYMTMQCKAKNK